MRNSWFFLGNLNHDGGLVDIFPIEPSHLSQGFGGHLVSQFASFIDGSTNCPNSLHIPGTITLGAIKCVSKFAGTFFLWLSTGFNHNSHQRLSGNSHGSRSRQSHSPVKHVTSCERDLLGLQFGSISQSSNGGPVFFASVATTTIRRLWKDIEQLRFHPMLSAAVALVPPFDHMSSKILALPPEIPAEQYHGRTDQAPCGNNFQGCGSLFLPNTNLMKDAIESRTGIKFPTILDNHVFGQDAMEVLVGTGYRTMRVIKIKTLNVYAFGLYVHPYSVCERLGPKYASIPVSELKNNLDFYNDLLREDIRMTVRLVVNCNGLKINTVRQAFEKSLRARLEKMNPSTDYHCLSVFGSYFKRDIPLPVGTTIDFRRTADGLFVTEISGKTIGAVHSRDLCRAFFDMYVGDLPVSAQAKEELAENVAGLIRRC
ncbi:unnamed protein product [Spirodela intermedia]|uniref:Chalcone--flavanone isomerase n=1 Tax=Spirodela intermedia TaxID=51605 RepID=A0A7I8KTG9_SPIIN|nr:unnamed protein product [Spirodela intermedia]